MLFANKTYANDDNDTANAYNILFLLLMMEYITLRLDLICGYKFNIKTEMVEFTF